MEPPRLLPLPLLILVALALSLPRSVAGARYTDDLLYGAPSSSGFDTGHINSQRYDQQQQRATTTESAAPASRSGRRARFALQDEVNLLAFGLLQLGQGVRELSERTAQQLEEAQGAVERVAAAAHGAELRAGDAERTAGELRERLSRLEEAWAPAGRSEAWREEAEESREGDDLAALASPSELDERDVNSPRLRRQARPLADEQGEDLQNWVWAPRSSPPQRGQRRDHHRGPSVRSSEPVGGQSLIARVLADAQR